MVEGAEPTAQALLKELFKEGSVTSDCSSDSETPSEKESAAHEHVAELKSVTCVNILVVVVLILVLLANAKEGKQKHPFTYLLV